MHGTTDLTGDFLTGVKRRNIPVIGATTPDKARHIMMSRAFNDRFEWTKVQALTPEERLQVLKEEIQRQEAGFPQNLYLTSLQRCP